MSHEARLHPRSRPVARVDILGQEVLLGVPVFDISQGGLRVATRGFELGAEVQLVLSFPSLGVDLPLTGHVSRVTPTETAIRFVGLADEQKWALRKHLGDTPSRSAGSP